MEAALLWRLRDVRDKPWVGMLRSLARQTPFCPGITIIIIGGKSGKNRRKEVTVI